MALALRPLFLLCGLAGLLTGVGSFPAKIFIDVSCPEGWTQVDAKCYILEEETREFQEAESVCNILGGNLASIANAVENAVVSEVAENDVASATIWIGIYDITGDNYLWTDGTRIEFDSYANGEPMSANGNCVEMVTSTAEWNTEPCNTELRYVCSREAGH
ncbi:galactose-specific lectin nattectin-like [Corythoichthys intestinalis]|uniref:galactose-specific lectin nattectin-like n=1 Tax=Corythoichthys intestinalis TaxID=161448 RepID=UPI0025A56A55|nr:galactose-specific lectin nattectin-like [Corythoichthys intestinalis]